MITTLSINNIDKNKQIMYYSTKGIDTQSNLLYFFNLGVIIMAYKDKEKVKLIMQNIVAMLVK